MSVNTYHEYIFFHFKKKNPTLKKENYVKAKAELKLFLLL